MLLVDLKIVNAQGKKELLTAYVVWQRWRPTKATFGAFSCASGLILIALPHQPLEAPSARLETFAGCHCHSIYLKYRASEGFVMEV